MNIIDLTNSNGDQVYDISGTSVASIPGSDTIVATEGQTIFNLSTFPTPDGILIVHAGQRGLTENLYSISGQTVTTTFPAVAGEVYSFFYT